ncbi:hypothetical protein DFP72DRAFT_1139772 [Ephemerocybe angulata]|uniref:Uncharacterized protein n=1 Tax=Ephemerocybe angulata TaxID=980116 RepID=A0A8H6HP76_9AGAR|nr:hypothetical protein DFP72DRAFT_1139772 [Tulosesus angulatus]
MADISLDVIADGILLGTRIPWGSIGDSSKNVANALTTMVPAANLSELHGTAASTTKAAKSSILVPWPLPSSSDLHHAIARSSPILPRWEGMFRLQSAASAGSGETGAPSMTLVHTTSNQSVNSSLAFVSVRSGIRISYSPRRSIRSPTPGLAYPSDAWRRATRDTSCGGVIHTRGKRDREGLALRRGPKKINNLIAYPVDRASDLIFGWLCKRVILAKPQGNLWCTGVSRYVRHHLAN